MSVYGDERDGLLFHRGQYERIQRWSVLSNGELEAICDIPSAEIPETHHRTLVVDSLMQLMVLAGYRHHAKSTCLPMRCRAVEWIVPIPHSVKTYTIRTKGLRKVSEWATTSDVVAIFEDRVCVRMVEVSMIATRIPDPPSELVSHRTAVEHHQSHTIEKADCKTTAPPALEELAVVGLAATTKSAPDLKTIKAQIGSGLGGERGAMQDSDRLTPARGQSEQCEDRLQPQQLAGLQVINAALTDAHSKVCGGLNERVGVLVTPKTSTPFLVNRSFPDCMSVQSLATQVATKWGFMGPTLTVSEGSRDGVGRAIDMSRRWLQSKEVDAVVVAVLDLHSVHHSQGRGGGPATGEAAAIVLMRGDQPSDYATIAIDTASVSGEVSSHCTLGSAADIAGPLLNVVEAIIRVQCRWQPGDFGKMTEPWYSSCRQIQTEGIRVTSVTRKTRSRIPALCSDGTELLEICGSGIAELLTRTVDTLEQIRNGTAVVVLMNHLRLKEDQPSACSCRLAIVASADTLTRELSLAVLGIQRSMHKRQAWTSPAGSCFDPKPLGPNVTFIFGDSASVTANLGCDYHLVYPALLDVVDFQRSASAVDSMTAKFRSGVFHAVCMTRILKDILGVSATAASGLSLGEISMMHAFSEYNCTVGAKTMQQLEASDVWNHELCEEMRSVRKQWNISDDTENIWTGVAVFASEKRVVKALSTTTKAYISMVMAPDVCIVTGDPSTVTNSIAEFGHAVVPQAMVAHVPNMVSPYTREIQDSFSHLEIPSDPQTQLWGNCDNVFRMLDSESDNFGNHAAQIYTNQAHLPNIIRALYQKAKSRIFVDIGSGNRVNFVHSALVGLPHAVIAADNAEGSTRMQLIKVAALMRTHGCALHIANLYMDDDL